MLTSKQNKNFKLWKQLKLKKYRDQQGLFLVYGPHLIEAAAKHNAIQEIITSNPEKPGTLIDVALMEELQQTETFIDQIAVCKKLNTPIKSDKILMLDDVQDPDNVGALIRSASAFGFDHIILSLKSADVYNEKTIRASKGALFDVFIERKPLSETIPFYQDKGYQVLYADAHESGTPLNQKKTILILGNEGHGISDDIKQLANASVHIPTRNVESLNVSVAGGILMYEWRER